MRGRRYLLSKNTKGLLLAIIAILIVALLKLFIFNGIYNVTPGEVKQNPNKFLGTTIAVEGYYLKGIPFLLPNGISSTLYPSSETEALEMLINILPLQYDGDVALFDGAKYRFIGELKEGSQLGQSYYYLQATEIESLWF